MFARFKKITMVLFVAFGLAASLCATGMPVIDISSIAESITQFVTTVQQYNRQIQQWKSEYDRMVKAAEGISSGNFMEIVNGIATIAGTMSGWADYADLPRSAEVLADVKDGSVSLLKLVSNGKFLMTNAESIVKTLESNLDRMQREYDKAVSEGNGFEANIAATGMATTGIKGILDLTASGGTSIANLLTNGADMVNAIADIFYTSPETVAEMYQNSIDQLLKDNKVTGLGDIARNKKALEDDRDKLLKEMDSYKGEENEGKRNELQTQINNINAQIEKWDNLEAFVKELQSEKAAILEQQGWYEDVQKSALGSESSAEQSAASQGAFNTARKEAEKKVDAALDKLFEYSASWDEGTWKSDSGNKQNANGSSK